MPKTKKTVATKKPVIAPKLLYKATLLANGKEYRGEADTLLEAIKLIKVEHYKTKGTLRIEYGDKKIDRFLFIPQMKKLFSGGGSLTAKIAMESTVKFITQLLK